MNPSRKLLSGILAPLLLAAAPALAEELTQWEKAVPNEEADAQLFAAELIDLIRNDYQSKGKRVFRDAHPRGIGCVEASFTVDPNLPEEFRTGVFAVPGKRYDAIARFSSSLGPAGDQVDDARGLAIKLFGVPGRKLLTESADAATHDFIHINAPTFPSRDAGEFRGIVRIKAHPTSAVGFILARPILRTKELKAFLDFSKNNPQNGKSLAEHVFFSQTAYLLKGPRINTPVKFSTRPCGPVPSRTLDGGDEELRQDLQQRLSQSDLCFDFAMQVYKDGVGFDVEDGMNEWREDKSPFIKFAKLRIPKQVFMTDEKLRYCDNLSFQPWHALPEHRPLGNINRTRKIVYELLSSYRHQANQETAARAEPTSLADWRSLRATGYSTWNSVTVPAEAR